MTRSGFYLYGSSTRRLKARSVMPIPPALFSAALGREVQVNRINVKADADTRLLVGQYIGPRLQKALRNCRKVRELSGGLFSVEQRSFDR
jgi:hypothetical protein